MDTTESEYTESFRIKDIQTFQNHLTHRHSIQLVGMKRVGINNFLRFYLGQKQKDQQKENKNLFINVDLNDLIEREIFPFWRLTFKRIIDAAEKSTLSKEDKQSISRLFVDAIQSGDLFLTYDGIRSSLVTIVQSGLNPTIFLNRFDRLKDVVTSEFFDNLQGLHTATNHNLAYIFTSFRELDTLAPHVFSRRELAHFSHNIYLKPANPQDSKMILHAFASKYQLKLDPEITREMINLSGGHVQYLQLALINLHENSFKTEKALLISLKDDERILLQSEELWESLDRAEQDVLKKLTRKEKVTTEEKNAAHYLWDTGFITGDQTLFSPLFSNYVQEIIQKEEEETPTEFSKKEYLLFKLLKENTGSITDREKIIESVWPEYQEFGVSDWSLDRLVARVRSKLKKQKTSTEIITVRTRGYKLIENVLK